MVESGKMKSLLFPFFSILLEVPSVIGRWRGYVPLNPEGNFIVCLYDEMHVALLFAH
jgi:hypothetical protein